MFLYWLHRPCQYDPWNDGYIGVSGEPLKRFKNHKRNHQNPHLLRALKSYEDVTLSLLYEGTEEECLIAELLFRPRESIGWNIAPGGGIPPSPKGKAHPWAVEHCRKIGKARAGKPSPHSIEWGRRNGKACKGRSAPWAVETAKKMALGNIGRARPDSIEMAKNMGKANKGRPAPHMIERCRELGKKVKGKHWYNNGEVAIMTFDCPPGFIPGTLRRQ